MTVISYPIPAYQNVPIRADFYQPRRFDISAITLGQETTVTTSVNHDYVIAQEVRLIIFPGYGCIQLNGLKGFVISIPSPNQVVITIDSSQNVDPYISAMLENSCQILAIGDVNTGVINTSGRTNQITYIPGSFINISPN